MRLDRKQWKITAGVAGIVAAAVLTTVLVLGSIAAPSDNAVRDNGVVARVNDEEITAEAVAEMQITYSYTHDDALTFEQALELLIREKLLYQEATREGYLLTREEAEQELLVQLAPMGMTGEDFAVQLARQGRSYDEYLVELQEQLTIARYLDDTVQIPEVTEEEAREFYEDYMQRFPEEPRTFEEMKSQIIMLLEEQKQQEAMFLLIEELRARAEIEYR